jgi:hydrogenase maturation protease
MNAIAVIGSGNAFFKDEGAGLYAAKYLKENYDFTPEVEFVDGGTLGFGLMPLLQEFSHVLIVNTASDDTLPPGSVQVRSCDAFLDESKIKKTANEVEIAEMVQICQLSGAMAETTLVSVVPEDIISVEVGLTPCLKTVWPTFIDAVLQQLSVEGVLYEKRQDEMTLEMILQTFAEPSIEHGRGF